MSVVVQKYGGTSLGTLQKLRRAASLAARAHRSGERTVVVVSARGSRTDELLALARQVDSDLPPGGSGREVDQLLATGECESAALMAMAVQDMGVPAVSLTGAQAGILVEGRHGSGVITSVRREAVTRFLDEGRVVVVAGFQGINRQGDVITLGRGGSDTTAVALAAALAASRCEIHTDVDGVHTADPRVVPGAKVLPVVDPGVMAEMAFAGAHVLHSRAIELAAMKRVEVRVRNSATEGPGTVVPAWPAGPALEAQGAVVAIAHDVNVARVLVDAPRQRNDLAPDMLAVLARHSVPVDLVARSGPNEEVFRMGFTIRRSDIAEVEAPLTEAAAEVGGSVRVDRNVGKVSLVGVGLLNRPEHTARMLATLAATDTPTSWISTSQLRSSATVPLDRVVPAVHALHRTFVDGDDERAVARGAPRSEGRAL